MPNPVPNVIERDDKKFQVVVFLAKGSFGSVHKGINTKSKEEVAIKFEEKNIEEPTLSLEWGFYKKLGEAHGIPKTYLFCPSGDWHAMVMELLGKSVEKKFVECHYNFPREIWAQIAMQMIDRLEYVHSKGKKQLCRLNPTNLTFDVRRYNLQRH